MTGALGPRAESAGADNELPSGAAEWDDLILVGIIARTHGIKGDVIVNPHTDFLEERFRPGARFWTRTGDGAPRLVEIASVRIHKGRPIVGLAGVGSMDEAEGWQGAELRISPAEQAPLPPGSYYHHELIGCAVETAEGEPVGRVTAVDGEMGRSRLVVEGGRRRVEIPLTEAFCEVDVSGRRITVRPPDGLLDL